MLINVWLVVHVPCFNPFAAIGDYESTCFCIHVGADIIMYPSRASFSIKISPILRKLQPVKERDTGFPKMYNFPYQSLQFITKYYLES